MPEVNEIKVKDKKEFRAVLIATISSVLLIIGVNLPLYVAQVLSSNTGKSRVNQEGLIILLAAIGAIVLIYLKKMKYVLVMAGTSVTVLIHYLILIPTLEEYKSFSYGYFIQWIAVVGLIASVFLIPKKEKEKENEDVEDNSKDKKENIQTVNDCFLANDLKWTCLSVVILFALLVLCDNRVLFFKEQDNKVSQAGSEVSENPSDNAVGTVQERSSYDFVGEECNINIDNAYILKYKGESVVVIEFLFSNKLDYEVSFGNTVIVDACQAQEYLSGIEKPDISLFDFNNSSKNVNARASYSVFYAYKLQNDTDDVTINIKMAIEPTITVCTKNMPLNRTYLSDDGTIPEQTGSTGEGDNNTTEAPVKTEKPSKTAATKSKTPSATQTVNTDEPVSSKTDAPKQTEATIVKTAAPVVTPEPVVETEFTVYFTKPSSWGNTIYTYVYSEDSNGVEKIAEWPGVEMKSVGDGKYSYKMDNKWEGKYIMFSDGSNQYPAGGQQGLTITKNGSYTVK